MRCPAVTCGLVLPCAAKMTPAKFLLRQAISGRGQSDQGLRPHRGGGSALRPPLDSGLGEAKLQTPGAENASRERDGLFEMVRRSASAAHFGETNPTNNHGLRLSVPALRPLRRVGRDDESFIRTKHQPAAVGNDRRLGFPVSGLFFTGNAATPTCRAVGPCSAAHRWCQMTPRAM